MIDSATLRLYHRQLLLACLHRAVETPTAGELLEQMGELALGLGHPKEALSGLSGPRVAGWLRELAGERQVTTALSRYNPTRGRNEPTWQPIGARRPDYPLPVAPQTVTAAAPPSAPGQLPVSREEVLSFLESCAGADRAMKSMADEIEALRTWARRLLSAASPV